tara:strand:+ start:3698 stop:4849 length:1152 start_codon:yes stop_codon:yes gene_type:complete
MKIVFLWDYYIPYLSSFYKRKKLNGDENFEVLHKLLKNDFFSWIGSLANGLSKNGLETKLIIGNDEVTQKKWAEENAIYISNDDWKFQILKHQIKLFKPDIFFFGVKKHYLGSFLEDIKKDCKQIFCWVGSPIELDTSNIDLVLSNNHHLSSKFSNLATNFKFFKPGFDKEILNHIKSKEKRIELCFVGQSSKIHHKKRAEYLAYLIEKEIPLEIYGIGYDDHHIIRKLKDFILSIKNNFLNLNSVLEVLDSEYYKQIKSIKKAYNNEAWGIDMYNILSSAKIIFNKHLDHPPNVAGNMRMFESTGIGTALITDYKEDIDRYFVPDKEIITYLNKSELIEKLDYYFDNNKELQDIAIAGQKRTLADHSIDIRAVELIDIIERL